MKAIFIDFDGVLHPAGGPPGTCLPFEWLADLAAVLRSRTSIRIVVHSSWRLVYPHAELREFLCELGVTDIDFVGDAEKAEAITAYLHAHPEVQSSLVLDDQPGDFPADFPCQVVACEPATGISSKGVQARIIAWLNT